MNDPINFIDPSGEIAISLTVIGVVAIFTVATGAVLYVYYTQVMPTLIDSTSSSRSATTTTASRGRDLASGTPSAITAQGSPDPDNWGTRTASTTLYNRGKVRIDVENPNPGARPGQIHVHYGKDKFIYDNASKSFRTISGEAAPNSVQKLLQSSDVQRAIDKGLRYLGY